MKLGLDILDTLQLSQPGPVDIIQSIIDTPTSPIILPDSIAEATLSDEEIATIKRMESYCKAYDAQCEEMETDIWEE